MRKRLLAVNTISSFIMQVTTIICGFILPRLILTRYGSEVNGLLNSITQFLQIIAFLELGVGAVVQSALYKPLADKDSTAISEIVTSANRFFRRIAYILLAYVAVLVFIFPYISETNLDHLNTAILIAIISISAFAQYYFGVVDSLLVTANQRGYIIFVSQTVALILNTLISVILINAGASIQIVKLVASLIFLLRPIGVRLYVNRHYAINRKIKYHREPIQQKWNGISQHIAAVVLNGTDVIVLTVFASLIEVSIYSVYFMVVSGVLTLVLSMTSGMQSLLGELWAKQEIKTLQRTFEIFEKVIHGGTVFVFGCTMTLILPFVQVYTLGIGDAKYIQPLFAGVLVLAFALRSLRFPYNVMILASGHYKQTQNNYIIVAALNIVISIITVKIWGLVGVAVGTLVAMGYQTIWMALYNMKNLLRLSLINLLKQLAIDALIATIAYPLASKITMINVSYGAWIIMALKAVVIWGAVVLVVNYIFYRSDVNVFLGKLKTK